FNTVVPSERKINDIQYIPDVSVFSDNASAVFNLYNAGIFTGVDEDGFFYGDSAITLEELCVVSHRAFDSGKSVKFSGIDTVSLSQALIPDFELDETDKNIRIKTDSGFEASESLISFIDTSLGGESSAEEVEDSVKTFAGIKSVADEYNFVLPADAHLILKEAIESNWAQVKQTIDKLGYDITEYAYFVNYWYSMFYQQMYYDYSYAKFPSGSELFTRYKDEFVLVKYIFVPYDFDEENYDASALLKAKEVLQKIADGADFDVLSAEYGENPDELFTYNQVAPQFETAAFALSENGISDIVDSAYGYYILKRIPLTEERFLSDGQQITELVSKYISEKFASLLEEHIEKINIVK
ncbi:MAG: peptidylprolyl isomerase, partial [Clostridia bacterium]|nr:peptidylprolyl isomerase [Clostridia bacterium]